MSTYKVIQDIEAEDHILGPLSLRQFIYALIAVFCFYICFICISKHVTFLLIMFLPPGLFFGFLAFPFGKDQPTEVWALAKIRFLIKPHRRVWNQSGVKELVTVTVPKHIEAHLTNGLSQNEVKSRLEALASTIDSRGWAVKNVNVNMSTPGMTQFQDDSDRLISLSNMPQLVPDFDIQASDDILDTQSNPAAQQMDQMITASTQAHRKQIIDELNATPKSQVITSAGSLSSPSQQWFTGSVQPTESIYQQTGQALLLADIGQVDEQNLSDRLHSNDASHRQSQSNLRVIQPLSNNVPIATATSAPTLQSTNFQAQTVPSAKTTPSINSSSSSSVHTPAIINLANNNDLDVATIARQASPTGNHGGTFTDEVVISLH